MIQNLQPRTIYYRDRGGRVGTIRISIRPLPDTFLSFSDDPTLTIMNAEVSVESEPLSHAMRVEALDEIQLVYRLLSSADVYIQTRFPQAGFEVFKIRPGDVDGAMDIYS